MAATTKQLTAEELLELPWLAMSKAESPRLGSVQAGRTGFVLGRSPDTVRAADVSFVSRTRIEAEGRVIGYRHGAPDLAIDIVSPSDRYTDVEEKVVEWLDGGARMVVVINPRRRSVTVYRSLIEARILTIADVLDGQDVVPGWQMPVAEMFED